MSNRRITKAATHKVGEYNLVYNFEGYRAREDKTALTPNVMVAPSQNVVLNTAGRVALVKGYTLDGQSSTTIDSGILSNFDFTNFKGDVRNTRAGFLTTAGNDGKLQYRYDDGTTVTWKDLKTGLTNVRMSYTGEFWDDVELKKLMLWVDGSNNIFEWNGALTTFASATATTLTKEGTTSWAEEGFYTTRDKTIVINGVTATYTGGELTTTLTGLSVDFSATAVGTVIHQAPVTTALSSMTAIDPAFGPTVIGCGRKNQVYLGASNSCNLYISKVSDYHDYTMSSPVRAPGDGALLPLDAPPIVFKSQEARESSSAYDLYIGLGQNTWSIVRATLSSDLTGETLDIIHLKVAPLQAPQSERLTTKMKNHIVFLGQDNVANFFGYMSYQYVPVMEDFSYSIIDDMNSYDFTDASMFYHKNYIYLAVPREGLVRIYNMTNQLEQQNQGLSGMEDVSKQPWFWEAPVTYPISGFYVVDGELYGHNYTTSESYKLFDGGSFNGQDIAAMATFAFDDKGDRTQSKGSNELWVEGYIKQNTDLNCIVGGDLDAFATNQTVVVEGDNEAYVSFGSGGGAIGKNPLGVNPLGGTGTSTNTLPAWFHVAKTYVQISFYLEQLSFYTKGVDLQWELITFGTNARPTVEGNNSITD